MSLSLYKPNAKNAGSAFSFQYGVTKNDEPCMFMRAIQQHGWDSNKKIGNFSSNREDASKNLSLKFNEFECGSILSAFKSRYEFNTFHTYEENKTTVKFAPWDKKIKASSLNPVTKKIEEKIQTIPAFGISVTRNGSDTFKISLEPGEVQAVSQFIKVILSRIYNFRIENHIKNQKEYKNS